MKGVTKLAIRVREAAEMLGMSETCFRKNVLPLLAMVPAGSDWRVLVADLTAWVDKHKVLPFVEKEKSGRSASATAASGTSSAAAKEIAARLRAKRERYMLKRSQAAGAQVIELRASRSKVRGLNG